MDEEKKETPYKEKRIRKITKLYYSRPEIQKAIFEFCRNREICPRYFESFGKRPDAFQYPGDVFELAKKGATSFNCSEELWADPLGIFTGMSNEQANEIRIGWDLVIDIDAKYIDYAKICAGIIINFLKLHGIRNIGIKFSGSRGFHLILPWEAFPDEINGVKTKNMFPEWPKIIMKYILEQTREQLIERISDIERPSRYVKNFQASADVMPDIALVSPRHLFRAPYSLHEKTALASVVLSPEEISGFDLTNADPLKISEEKVKNFMPEARKNEAGELLLQALDWSRHNKAGQDGRQKKEAADFEPVKISEISDRNFPPSIKKILEGMQDGKKRALFILINFFRSIGLEKGELEKRIYEWNNKNNPKLREGYLKAHLLWSYKKKVILPPNFDRDYYEALGIALADEELRFKNPVNYFIRKSLRK